mmetsp:Transcript_85757/g.170236  ORF Transcript_85757/g.170236 Transcript_85757/m.170236 type:complete len:405 (-) Transcript_85757:23-1237(-)
MARLSFFILAVIIDLPRGVRDESEGREAQNEFLAAFDQDAQGTENPYYTEKQGWEDEANQIVKELISVHMDMRQNFRPVNNWGEVAGLSMHMMIATRMLENLKTATHVADIGSGTGALLAVFAELVPKTAVVEGLEYMTDVADASKQKMAEASVIFKKANNSDAEMVAKKISVSGIAGGELNGNLFTFNLDGGRDEEFDVINVGFAMFENEIPAALWKALAVKGKLGIPICKEKVYRPKCEALYHIYTKNSPEAVRKDDELIIQKDINFVLVRAPEKHCQAQEGGVQVECPTLVNFAPCTEFSKQNRLPEDAAVFFKLVFTENWMDNATKTSLENDWGVHMHREETVWQGGVEQDARWGLKVVYDLDCEEGYSVMTWTFFGFGELECVGESKMTATDSHSQVCH